MPMSKVIINNSTKIKVKTNSKKGKDIRIQCPEEFLADTITLFKSPEKLVLTDSNVIFLSQLCETYKDALIDLKPVFLKRVADVQEEIDRIMKEQSEEAAKDEEIAGAEPKFVEMDNSETPPLPIFVSETQGNTLTETTRTGTSTTDSVTVETEQLSTETEEDKVTGQQSVTMTTDVINSVGMTTDISEQHSVTMTTDVSELQSVTMTTDGGDLCIRETRERMEQVQVTSVKQTPELFVRIISPKHRVVTRYSNYSPQLSPPESDGDPIILMS